MTIWQWQCWPLSTRKPALLTDLYRIVFRIDTYSQYKGDNRTRGIVGGVRHPFYTVMQYFAWNICGLNYSRMAFQTARTASLVPQKFCYTTELECVHVCVCVCVCVRVCKQLYVHLSIHPCFLCSCCSRFWAEEARKMRVAVDWIVPGLYA